MFDIIIPVYNSMHHVRTCITSVFKHALGEFHVYIVDDFSDVYTQRSLRTLLASHDSSLYTVIRHSSNMGYLASVNEAISLGQNQYVVLLNSDTAIASGFLERLRFGFESDRSISIINPVSTWANWTRIPFPDGFNIIELSREVNSLGTGQLPDINNASGFCFAARRSLYEQIGLFDPIYGPGYWEEADLCMRALANGHRVVVDDKLYVFHHGWGSFMSEGRNLNMSKNEAIFMDRWAEEYEVVKTSWKNKNPITDLISSLSTVKETKRLINQRADFKDIEVNDLHNKMLAFEGSGSELKKMLNLKDSARQTTESPRVIFILPAVKLYGGVISVLQVVNQLILHGYNANIATYGQIDEESLKLFPTLFRPFSFASMEDLVCNLPYADIIVATAWNTVYPSIILKQKSPSIRLMYFVQDFEPDFYPPEQAALVAQAERTYSLINDKIVKTDWLMNKLLPYDGNVHKIPLGLNLDFFHDHQSTRRRQIISMARPSSNRRNFDMLVSVFEELHRLRPEVKLAIYGHGYDPNSLPFPCVDYGKITSMKEIAGALNDSEVLLDCSTFQGFGRPGLEAMACGTAAVLTCEGGITQYAKHESNCLLIDPRNKDNILEQVIRVIDDLPLRQRIVAEGLKTAETYSLENEGKLWVEAIDSVLREGGQGQSCAID